MKLKVMSQKTPNNSIETIWTLVCEREVVLPSPRACMPFQLLFLQSTIQNT